MRNAGLPIDMRIASPALSDVRNSLFKNNSSVAVTPCVLVQMRCLLWNT
jgi:hypothetical protein